MKTIDEAARSIEFNKGHLMSTTEQIATVSFRSGVEFAQRWIPVEYEMPAKITNPSPQSNGNTLYFYENYLIKGYYENKSKTEEVLIGVYMPCSVCWYFNVIKPVYTLNFIVTHWRPIELK